MTPALKLDNLGKSFGRLEAVRALDLEVEPGEMFALLGPNGAGKSTTINMIAGVCRIDRGSAQIFGHDVVRDYRTTRWLTGVMHQEVVIDHFFTIDRALSLHAGYYGVADDRRWRETLIERLGLRPHLHKPMIQLSGGLKRRFMVAKAMIHRPRLLILDEPTAGVDVELRQSLWAFVRDINREGVTVLLTTHYLEEAEQLCRRVAIMDHGELVALDETSRLLARCGQRQIRLTLAAPLTALDARLQALGGTLDASGRVLALPLPAEQPAGALLQTLLADGLQVEDVETRQPDLEDVFLQLTGKARRPAAGH